MTAIPALVLNQINESARGPTKFSHWGSSEFSRQLFSQLTLFSNSKSSIGKCISR